MVPERIAGDGWLVLIGGGEFSFEETERADAAWLAKMPADGVVGFLPAASSSDDYARHFAVYLDEYHERRCETVPIYRQRDARRGRNAARIAEHAAVYLGGGVPDHLLDCLRGDDGKGSPALDALRQRLVGGGVVVAIAGVAQTLGHAARSLFGGKSVPALGWLPGGVVEPNYEPGKDRRLRQLMAFAGVRWGLAIPAGSAVLLGPGGVVEVVGKAWLAAGPDAPLEPFAGRAAA